MSRPLTSFDPFLTRFRAGREACSSTCSPRGAGRDRKGFTLVEVMVAGVLMVLLISSAVGVLLQVASLSKNVQNRTDASMLAWSRVERARNMEFEDLEDLVEEPPGSVVDSAGLLDAKGRFQRTTSVTTTTNGLVVKHVKVTVVPKGAKRADFDNKGETVETVIADIPRAWEDS